MCTSSSIAPTVCPYPDALVSQSIVSFQMPKSTMTCKSFFQYIVTNFPNQNPNDYCSVYTRDGPVIGSICCQECKKYAGIKCFNSFAYVSYCNANYLAYCSNGVFSDGTLFKVACAKLCGTCTSN